MTQNEIILNVFLIARVCSIHFADSCFEKKPDHLIVPGDLDIYRLSKVAVPTLNFPNDCDNSRFVLL